MTNAKARMIDAKLGHGMHQQIEEALKEATTMKMSRIPLFKKDDGRWALTRETGMQPIESAWVSPDEAIFYRDRIQVFRMHRDWRQMGHGTWEDCFIAYLYAYEPLKRRRPGQTCFMIP